MGKYLLDYTIARRQGYQHHHTLKKDIQLPWATWCEKGESHMCCHCWVLLDEAVNISP